jgi:sterol desaturase/sphingolipid hydroxylase (fatty acid hydroxylase superfamily)
MTADPITPRAATDLKASPDAALGAAAGIGLMVVFGTALVAGILTAEALVPHKLTFSLLGHTFSLARAGRAASPMVMISLALAPLVFALEMAVLGWRRSSLRRLAFFRSTSSRADLVWFALQQLHIADAVGEVLTLGVAAVTGVWLGETIRRATGVSLSLRAAPLIAQVVSFYLVFGFFDYWTHRIKHGRLFWPLHRFHHAADDFFIVTSDRVHPADVWSRLTTSVLAQTLLGTPAEIMVGVGLFQGFLQYVRHSRLDWDFGWIGRYLVQSPAHHRLHHRLAETAIHSNLGVMPLWDHVFGTWREAPTEAYAVGVHHPYGGDPGGFGDLWRDYWEFWSVPFGDLRRAVRLTCRAGLSRLVSAASSTARSEPVNGRPISRVRTADRRFGSQD